MNVYFICLKNQNTSVLLVLRNLQLNYVALLFKSEIPQHLCISFNRPRSIINILKSLRDFQDKLLYLVYRRNFKKINFDPKAPQPSFNIDISSVAYHKLTADKIRLCLVTLALFMLIVFSTIQYRAKIVILSID